ncbi:MULTISPECIES: O-antigen polymerase [unclassified Exiguobacterium]|uniref:O-antigen polymerase n=1 Tax=unclassified Exiguobacterium TaxID=2644629 RepID=UPI001039D76E|nr:MULTISPECIES: O-antigen polymerase [unclassified Exiguobacterium]TCI48270.1 oligosaccharide repeat unit polymerase [Exiguobacterium sp. SH5S32]TCI55156.1 oligosaccharide repeat unit polymerase [Exiguobacterium sp. SH1S4]TCI74950.1 oligosaccharide repeat unit polymerase [Exiguobacterium sp. SH1S1]
MVKKIGFGLSFFLSIVFVSLHSYESIYLILAFIILAVELGRNKINWDYLSVINYTYILLYCIVPMFMYRFPEELHYYIDLNNRNILVSSLYVYLGYFFILCGYFITFNKSLRQDFIIKDKILFKLSLLFFTIGLISFSLYASSYGGFQIIIENADRIRSGWFTTSSPFVFFKLPSAMLTLSFWIAVSLLFNNKANEYTRLFLLFLVATTFTIALARAFATAGRSEILYLISPVILGWYLWRNKKPSAVTVIGLSVSFVFFLLNGDQIIRRLNGSESFIEQNRESGTAFFDFLREFSHPYASLNSMIISVPHPLSPGLFSDLILSVVQLVPERLLGINLPFGVSGYNTYQLTGVFKETIPPGLLGFLFYSLPFAGVILGSFLFGHLVRRLELYLTKFKDTHPIYTLLYVAFGITIFGFMMGGDPKVYLNLYLWSLIIGALIIIFFTKKK